MQISDLKQGLFGYKKENVYHYITELNEECSKRIAKSEEESSKRIKELEQRNAMLEEKLTAAQAQVEASRKDYSAIADSIVDAQQYALQMKNATQDMEEKNRTVLYDSFEKGKRTVEDYFARINSCRLQLKSLLESIDDSLENVESQTAQLAGETNIFEKKSLKEPQTTAARSEDVISLNENDRDSHLQKEEDIPMTLKEKGFFLKENKSLFNMGKERNEKWG